MVQIVREILALRSAVSAHLLWLSRYVTRWYVGSRSGITHWCCWCSTIIWVRWAFSSDMSGTIIFIINTIIIVIDTTIYSSGCSTISVYVSSLCIYIYIWYISYYSKNCCIHSMLLFVVSLFYSHSLYVYVLLIRVYVLYEWYIFVISINFVMFSCIYMIYIIWIEKEL